MDVWFLDRWCWIIYLNFCWFKERFLGLNTFIHGTSHHHFFHIFFALILFLYLLMQGLIPCSVEVWWRITDPYAKIIKVHTINLHLVTLHRWYFKWLIHRGKFRWGCLVFVIYQMRLNSSLLHSGSCSMGGIAVGNAQTGLSTEAHILVRLLLYFLLNH